MKTKIVGFFVCLIIFSNVAWAIPSVKMSSERIGEMTSDGNYSHTVIGECGTGVNCKFCKYSHAAMKNIYAGGWHPFYYVSLVTDKNKHAKSRSSELGIIGIPNVHFDGSYRNDVGAASVPIAQGKYNESIVACKDREISDVDTYLDVTWNGDAEMFIEVSVDNNEADSYKGHIRVYVTEIVSSMGWYDSWGYPYTFAFLDYAFNEDISVSARGSWVDSIVWDGHDYNDGYGNDFGDITYGNIMIIAAVFNSGSGWVDDTVGFRVGDNTAPNIPSDPYPEEDTNDVYFDADLSWSGGDPEDDLVTYDVYFGYLGMNHSPPKMVSNQSGMTYDPGEMKLNTMYYWKIVAWDCKGLSTSGPVWYFTTELVPDNAPNKPSIPSGPANGKAGSEYTYTTNTTDIDGHQVYYLFDWGDYTKSGWVGPYNSGENGNASHNWTLKGTYQIRVKAKDTKGAESEWSDPLSVTMPRNYNLNSKSRQRIANSQPFVLQVLRRFLDCSVFSNVHNSVKMMDLQ